MIGGEVVPAGRKAIQFGLIGLGRHGSRYADHLLHDVSGAQLVAVCRRDRERGRVFARQHGLVYYDEYSRLIEDPRVEAVAVAVSPDVHVDICRRAVAAGKHLLLEKPLARNVREAREILDIISGATVKFMLAQTLRFNCVVQEMWAHRGQVGRIHLMALNQRMEHYDLAWLDDPQAAGGGNVLHTGVHTFDLIRFLSGQEIAWAWCRTERVYQRQTEDLFAAVLGLSEGVNCLVDSCKVTGGRSGRIELVGEKGQLIGDHVLGTLFLIRDREPTALATPPPVHTVRKALEAFVDCIVERRPPPITAQDGLRTLEVVEMCYRSARDGVVVWRDEI